MSTFVNCGSGKGLFLRGVQPQVCRRRSSRVLHANLDAWFVENSKGASISVDGALLRGIRGGAEVFSLPSSAMITRKVVDRDLPRLKKSIDDYTALALWLIMAKYGGLETIFSPYIASLPTDLNLPMFWSADELEALQGSPLESSVSTIKDRIDDEYESIKDSLDEGMRAVLSKERYLWAQGIIISRSFELSDKLPVVLAPVVDAFPISASNGCSVRSVRGGLFGQETRLAVVAERDLSPPAKISINRNAENNGQYLLDYGIAFQDRASGRSITVMENEAAHILLTPDCSFSICSTVPSLNTAELVFGVSSMDPFYEDKLDILEQRGMEPALAFTVREDEPLDGSLADMSQFLRLVCISVADAFLLEAIFRQDVWEFMASPISSENEEQMCLTGIAACEAQLEEYRDFSSDDTLSSVGKLGQIVIKGEKAALRRAKLFFENEMKQLEGKEYYQERRLRDLDLLRPVDSSEIVDSDSAGRSAQAFDDYY